MPLSIEEHLRLAPATSKQIQVATGLSQTAVSRQLRGMQDRVVKIPQGRSPKYALTRNAFGSDDRLPLYTVDAHGNSVWIAVLRPLVHGGFVVEETTGMPPVLLGERGDGVYPDLPYFLYDLAPQGFIGRQIASEMALKSDNFPADPRLWSAEHIGQYLVSNGDDLPGDIVFGEAAFFRVRRKPKPIATDDYPALADAAMRGLVPGSSAGGEQPKFTAYCGERSAYVIVKFSPKGGNPVAQRWRDILITEYHATEAIHQQNLPAAETRLIEKGGRLFLESERFDRSGEYGRLSMISLQAVDAEFTGLGSDWPRVLGALYRKELVGIQHFLDAQCLWLFGRLINNTDMHLGNLSLRIEGGVFRLLPVYDMCSMGFAPKSGEVLPYRLTLPGVTDTGIDDDIVNSAKDMARDFWQRIASDARISGEFRAFLAAGNPIDQAL